jgi:hypothetical protein
MMLITVTLLIAAMLVLTMSPALSITKTIDKASPVLSASGSVGTPVPTVVCGMGSIGAERGGGGDARKNTDNYHRGRGGRYIGHSPTAGTLGNKMPGGRVVLPVFDAAL